MPASFGPRDERSSSPRQMLGRRGEAMAATYLRGQGYAIIATNWRCARGELDLVARDGATLVFVEVRTRRSAVPGAAAESITIAKQRRLAHLARTYLERADGGRSWNGAWRIDVIGVELPPRGPARIAHLHSAIQDWGERIDVNTT